MKCPAKEVKRKGGHAHFGLERSNLKKHLLISHNLNVFLSSIYCMNIKKSLLFDFFVLKIWLGYRFHKDGL